MPGFRFQLSLWPTLAAVAGIALTFALGTWQLDRGHEKAALAERIKSAHRDALIAMPAAEIRANKSGGGFTAGRTAGGAGSAAEFSTAVRADAVIMGAVTIGAAGRRNRNDRHNEPGDE